MRNTSYALLVAMVVGCSGDLGLTQRPALDARLAPNLQYSIVKDTASLGGTRSISNSINNLGDIAGFSNLAGNRMRHAALWQNGLLTDLGTLGGPNSSVAWAGQNESGTIVGFSQTVDADTLGESWSCAAFFPAATGTGRICLGFVWENGSLTAMPTLGGENSYATGVNDHGRVVGWAETRVHDPTCNAPQVLQFRAVVWEPRSGSMRQLRPLPGDSASAATAINEGGQVVGISGDCDVAVGQFSARHAVLWERDTMIQIPGLGGTNWHTPVAINERGTVVGFSNPPGDQGGTLFIPHAFLWTKQGSTRDLGTLQGDQTSQANGINARGQVVGVSSGAGGNRAFLWRDGVMIDLNTLAGPGFADRLVSATDINDAGQITGRLLEAGTGKTMPFVATPVATDP